MSFLKYTLTFLLLMIFSSVNVFSGGQLKQFIVFLNTNPERKELSKEKVMELQKGHLANIIKLAKKGVILAAGPFDGGGGIFVMKAKDEDEVNGYLRTDPAINAGRFKLEIFSLKNLCSNICMTKEPYEMVTYKFIRIKNSKYEPDTIVNLNIKKLYEGELSESGERILIFRQAADQGCEMEFKNIVYQKDLWIAKGTFCE